MMPEKEIQNPRSIMAAAKAAPSAGATNAMEDPAPLEPLGVDGGQDVGAGVAAVDDGREAQRSGQGDLAPEDRALNLGRRQVVMVIEADFSDRRDRSGRGQGGHGFGVDLAPDLGFVGMETRRGLDLGVPGGKFQNDRPAAGGGDIDGAEDGPHAGGAGPGQDLGAVGVEIGHIEMGVRVDHVKKNLCPHPHLGMRMRT